MKSLSRAGGCICGVVAGSILSIAAVAPVQAQAIEWKESYYNPQPAGEDLILPMPCGGAMVFRRIDTPNAEGVIGDIPVLLGEEGGAQPFLNGLRRDYVSGAFSNGSKPAGSHFFMAKYELSQAQYRVVMEASCPEKAPRKRDFLPQVGQSKLDFERFAERYTLWLMKSFPDALPMAGQTHAFLRLPSEAEWEFAARGGLALEEALFRAPLPPLQSDEQIAEYVAYGGARSAGGKLQIIGTLRPNPLGLHDMLGNAAEIVATPFALVRHGRMHGQVGGYVKRGGDARTPIDSLTLATRYEVPPYDSISGVPMTDRFTGTRLVISALSITSPEQSQALVHALEEIARPDPGQNGAAAEDEVLTLLGQMAKDAVTRDEKSRIALIRDTLDAAQTERNTQRDRSIRLIMTSSVLVCDQTIQRYLNALAIGLLIPDYDQMEQEALNAGDRALAQEVRTEKEMALEQLNTLNAKAMGEVVDYANFIEGLGADFSAGLLGKQLGFLKPKIQQRSERRAACVALLEQHLTLRGRLGFADVGDISKDFQNVALDAVEDQ